ncbi:MAG TPA: transporter substrate-binding domain-containing protein, partial [Candidatus Limnocylindrales bacterium]|nr:transporter substrate-binding domain-containing protein [Candidatus Limnocylindrales bacterium]
MNWLVAIVLACCSVSSVFAQPAQEQLKVATRIVKPFVFEENSRLTGFSVELWNEIAKQLNVATEYVVKPTVKELLSSVNNHEAALGIAAISITAERELHWDFSQPMFEAGLQILAPVHGGRATLIRSIFANLLSTAVLPYVLAVASILLIIAHLV